MEILELKIVDLARAGTGVAREASGRVVFVPFTAPGDLVRARITSQKKKYAQAELLAVIEPSPSRVKPPCPVFGKCGGCQWQHLPYETQWKTKVHGARQALERAGIAAPAPDELPAERIWEYRNRVQARGHGDALGFFASGSHQLVAVDRCAIARPELNAAWGETRLEGARLRGPYKVELEILENGTLRKHWNQGHAAGGFRQVHDEQNVKLQGWVAGAVTKGRVLFDLFGGAGNLSRPFAREMAAVHCVDSGAPAGKSDGIEFHRSTVLPWLLRRQDPPRPSSAILDPPREGLEEAAPEIAASLERLGTDEIVTVGCDIDSWIKDLLKFLSRGWRLERIAVVDLFPQTPHVEALALLKRSS